MFTSYTKDVEYLKNFFLKHNMLLFHQQKIYNRRQVVLFKTNSACCDYELSIS